MKRDRLTITLDTNLLEAIDTLIDKQTLRNRSQTIEFLLKEGLALHELHHAFIFLENEWSKETLIQTVKLLAEAGVRHLYVAASSQKARLVPEITLALQEYKEQYPQKEISHTFIPADFGSGGAVVLQQTNLNQPFFLAWIGTETLSVESLMPFYTFHRQHHQPLSVMIQGSNILLALANPDIITQIPPGLSSLRQTVFPHLVKTGTVRGYLVG